MSGSETKKGPQSESKGSVGVRNQGIRSYDLYPTNYFRFRPGLFTVDTNSPPIPIPTYELWRISSRLSTIMKGRLQTIDYQSVKIDDLPADHAIRKIDTKNGFIERLMIAVEKITDKDYNDSAEISKVIENLQTVYPSYGYMPMPAPPGVSRSWWNRYWNSTELENFSESLKGKTIIGKHGIYIDLSQSEGFQDMYERLNQDIYDCGIAKWRSVFCGYGLTSLKTLFAKQ